MGGNGMAQGQHPILSLAASPSLSPRPPCLGRFYGLQDLSGWENLALQVPFMLFFASVPAIIIKYVQYGVR